MARFPYHNPKRLYQGSRVNLLSIEAKRGERVFSRELVDHPGAVVILPIIEDSVVLIRNVRDIVCDTLWELPAGTLEEEEAPEDAALRELEEETGYLAAHIEPMLQFYTSPGSCNEMLHIFLAKELTLKEQKLDATEEIEVEMVSLKKALEMIYKGEIIDGKTIATLLYYQQFIFAKRLSSTKR